MRGLAWLRKRVWLIPIVLVVGTLMVLPGGAFLASASSGGNPLASAAGVGGHPSAAGTLPQLLHAPSGTSSSSSPLGPSVTPPSSLPTFQSNAGTSQAPLGSAPAALANTPWVQSIFQPGATGSHALASYPNLNLLENPETGSVHPGYTGEPAPLGIGDYGLGATTYSYNTSHFVGTVTFNTPPNATQPGATGVIEPSAQGQHLGYVGSPYEFGIQLNTVATNISFPGSDAGFFWTQNVVNWNDTGIHFVDDTFNFSAGSGFYLAPGTIYSGCNNNSAGVDTILYVYGGVFQCVGGTIPLSPASYPVTIQLYNNATINAQNRTQVAYGYRIIESGTGTVYTGISDTVVFNNPTAATAPPANTPGFSVDGFTPAPVGLLRDAEIDIVGGIGGDNAIFRSINGTASLMYSNASSGGWQTVPSAYNFGADTGETSAGIADYWVASSHTLSFNQGPTMLYGLWNAEPQVSVASGDIQIAGSITPAYGFVFVGNVVPGVYGYNLSWMPTTDAGTFNTYLPPLGAPWTTTYYVQAFADGFAETNTTVTAATTSLTLTLARSPGTLNAPLYAFSNAQVASLATNVTLSGAPPWTFIGLTVDVNLTFNHLNDYMYPSFVVFQTDGVTQAVNVSGVYQGPNSGPDTLYFYDAPWGTPITGVLNPPPSILPYNLAFYTSIIDLFGGTGDQLYLQELETFCSPYTCLGAEVVLWQDTNAYLNETIVFPSNQGVWVGDSTGTLLKNTEALLGYGVTDIGSSHTTVWNLYDDGGLGINGYSTSDSTYSWINVTNGGEGIAVGGDFGGSVMYDSYYDLPGSSGLSVNDLYATDNSLGANITFSSGTSFYNVTVYDPTYYGSAGIQLDGTTTTTIDILTVSYTDYYGMEAWNAAGTTVTQLSASYVADGAIMQSSTGMTFTDTSVYESTGIWGLMDSQITLTNFYVDYSYNGFTFYNGGSTATVTNFYANYTTFGAEFGPTFTGVTATNVNLLDDYIGFNIYQMTTATVTTAVVNDSLAACSYFPYCGGVVDYGSTGVTISNVIAENDGEGVHLDGGAMGITVSNVAASNNSYGVVGDSSSGFPSDLTLSGVTATYYSLGDLLSVENATVSGTSATYWSGGDVFNDASQVTDTGASVTGGNSTAVVVELSSFVTVSDVTATAGSLTPIFTLGGAVNVLVAVATESDTSTIVSGVTATNYGAALIDYSSDGLQLSALNDTGGNYGMYLDGTYNAYVSGLGAYQDWVGLYLTDGADGNYVTASSFVDDTSYGVVIYGYGNTISGNSFIGDNGATSTFSPAHIQAWANDANNFYTCTVPVSVCSSGVGNYWADWHTYGANGYLAPYVITGLAEDLFPTGPAETFAVTFTETGLSSGASWSVTLNGVTQVSNTTAITFQEPLGSYDYQVAGVSGYSVTPASGSVSVSGAPYAVGVTYTSTSTSSLASTSDLNNYFAVALAIGLLALVIALVALFMRRRSKPSEVPPPAAWTPPATSNAPPPAGGSGSSNWSEGQGGSGSS